MLGQAVVSSTKSTYSLPLKPSLSPLCFQQTLAKTVRCEGVGVHSGLPVRMAIKPAAANVGYVFVRTDLSENNVIPALWNNVTDTSMCTKITNEAGASVGTIEHLIAALAGLRIHNAIIEVDSPEVPIMDGSSAVFVKLIQKAGVKRLAAPIRNIRVLKPIQVTHGQSTVFLLPSDESRITMEFDFHGRFEEGSFFSYYPETDDFSELLSEARTFGLYEDAQRLRAAGLAKGASLENTIVIGEEGVMNEEGLRYEDEFVRHKVLDAVGDLALAGAPLLAHYDGVNAGHGLNNRLLHALFQDPTAWVYEESQEIPVLRRSMA